MKKLAVAFAVALMLLVPFLAGFAEETQITEIDMDLSAMNANINYAQMVQVLNNPSAFAGKTICVKGKFNYSEASGRAKIIFSDAAGCCEIAMEFVPGTVMNYPEDYPALYTDIVVVGRLEAGGDAGEKWIRIEDAMLIRPDQTAK